MVWWLKALTALLANPGLLIPSTHMVAFDHVCHSNSKRSKVLF